MITFTNEIIRDARKAGINPSILNPFTIVATSISINALITNVKRPRVRIVIGNVRIIKRGLKVMLISPNTIATINAV
jgi:hypothetical protein